MTLVTLSRVEHGQLADYPDRLRLLAIRLSRGDEVGPSVQELGALATELEQLALAFRLREEAAR